MPTYHATIQDPETGESKNIGIVADSFEDAGAAAVEQRLEVASWSKDQPRSGLDLLHWQNTQIIRLLEYGQQQNSKANTLLDRMDVRFASRSMSVEIDKRSMRKIKSAILNEVLLALVFFAVLLVVLCFLVAFLFGAMIMTAAGTP